MSLEYVSLEGIYGVWC